MIASTPPKRIPTESHEELALGKERELADWMRDRGSLLLGFSGGVDSSYLAVLAARSLARESFLAVIGRSASYPDEQWAAARAVATRFEIPWLEVDTEELAVPAYAANPTNRCYFCKSELWGRLVPIARERRIAVVIDGTNADDLSEHRPGARAARELGVESPLALLGFGKADVRARSRALGIPQWDKPSSPCLSSRIPYGVTVTSERLARVERAERAVRELGFTGDMRVRYHGDLARVELAADAIEDCLAADVAQALAAAVKSAGFLRVALDLRGFRSGSLNVLAGVG
jgi:pyridinium-3,5-biscarboxylic acid mononucleotide sulfurtransferase